MQNMLAAREAMSARGDQKMGQACGHTKTKTAATSVTLAVNPPPT